MDIMEKREKYMNDDTIKLLKECDAGIKMGISSLEDVIDEVKNEDLKTVLMDSRDRHCKLEKETTEYLNEYHDDGKEPAMFAKAMSKIKTDMKLMAEYPDKGIAGLITDGCNMGLKSLNMYLNQYPTAIEKVKALVGKVLKEEEKLVKELRVYL